MRFVIIVILSLLFLSTSPHAATAQIKDDCSDYDSQEDAQNVLDGLLNNEDFRSTLEVIDIDPDAMTESLDTDGDGIACESLDSSGDSSQSRTDSSAATGAFTQEEASLELTSQEETYFNAILADGEEIASIMERLGPMFQEAGTNPTVIFESDWQIEMAGILLQWEMVAENAQNHTPSPRQQHIHDIWLEIASLNLKSIDDIIQGIDNIDAAVLERGTARMNYATLLIEDVTAAVTAFYADPNAEFEPTHALNPVPDCQPLPDYDEAQLYYAAYPEEQPTIDPDFDGLACEVYFGRG